jgi:galactokinase/mevalonate kinase-like predicted kinase
MVTIMKPGSDDSVSVRRVHETVEDRKKFAKQYREQKEHEQKMKEERFAKIEERRKDGPKGSGSGSSSNINVEVTSD